MGEAGSNHEISATQGDGTTHLCPAQQNLCPESHCPSIMGLVIAKTKHFWVKIHYKLLNTV